MSRGLHKPDLLITVPTGYTAEVRGLETYRVLDRLQCPRQFQYSPPSGGHPCWTVPAKLVADVVAMAEHLGGVATVDAQQVLA